MVKINQYVKVLYNGIKKYNFIIMLIFYLLEMHYLHNKKIGLREWLNNLTIGKNNDKI